MAYIKTRKTKKGITYHLVDIVNGIEKAVKLSTNSKREAMIYLNKYLGDKADNKPNALLIKKVKFDDFVTSYLETSKHLKNETTYSKDLSHLKPLLLEWSGKYLHQIDYEAIQSAQKKWLSNDLSKKTVKNRCMLLSAILRSAHDQKILVELPKLPQIKIDKRQPFWYSEEQLKTLLTQTRPLVRDFSLVLVNTGIRKGELQRLKWEHIDIKNKKILIEISKSHKFRSIPINPELEKHLIKMYANRKPGQIYLFEGNVPGSPYTDYYHAFKRELNRLKLPGNVHTLRHTFASRLVQNGVSIYEVSKLLGHAMVTTTQIYAHLNDESLQKAVNVLSNIYEQEDYYSDDDSDIAR